MKNVRIYELTVRFERVPAGLDAYKIYRYNQMAGLVSGLSISGCDPIASINGKDDAKGQLNVGTTVCAIQRFRAKPVKDQVILPDGLYDFDELCYVDDEYIVLDPHVEHLLAGKYNEKIAELTMKQHKAEMLMTRQKQDLEKWWSLPWYKRVLSALKGSA